MKKTIGATFALTATKPVLTKETLGKRAFWTGCIFGILAAIIFALFFHYSRKAIVTTTNHLQFRSILPCEHNLLYDLFFAALSTSLGFCVTTIFWMLSRKRHPRKGHLKAFAVSNAAATICVTMLCLSTLAYYLFPVMLQHTEGVKAWDNMMSHNYIIMMLLIPVCIFLSQWNMIRLSFRTKGWFWPILKSYLVVTALLFLTFSSITLALFVALFV